VVLGGGKQAHMRGGDLRRVVVHGAALHGADIADVYLRLANDHPGIGGRASRIQAVYRGFIVRKKRDEEIKKNKAEFDSDAEEGEGKEGKDGEKEGEKEKEAAAEQGEESGSGSASEKSGEEGDEKEQEEQEEQ
jgi:hypothetical protein